MLDHPEQMDPRDEWKRWFEPGAVPVCPVCGKVGPAYQVERVGDGTLGCEACLFIRRGGQLQ